MLERIKNEPARAVAVVLAVVGVLTAFGLGITEGQSGAVVALVSAVLVLAGGEVTRTSVTPVARLSRNENGVIDTSVGMVLLLATFVLVLLLAFGVLPPAR